MIASLRNNKKQIAFRTLFVILASATIIVLLYPHLPAIQYEAQVLFANEEQQEEYPVIASTPNYVLVGTQKEGAANLKHSIVRLDNLRESNLQSRPVVDPAIKRLVIGKIGVEMPIIVTGNVYNEEDAYEAMDKGAWLYSQTSTPDAGSNTVITGHRFKHVPPSSNTLYLLDKVKEGDEVLLHWKGREYTYKVTDSKVVEPSDLSVVKPTQYPTLTIITCTPLWSTKQRLVVTAQLIGTR